MEKSSCFILHTDLSFRKANRMIIMFERYKIWGFWDKHRVAHSKSTDVSEEHVAFNQLCCLPTSCWFLAWFILLQWRSRWYIPPKHQLTLTDYIALCPTRKNSFMFERANNKHFQNLFFSSLHHKFHSHWFVLFSDELLLIHNHY
jgi:hypothetical protein